MRIVKELDRQAFKGKNFKMPHILIQNVKNWPKGRTFLVQQGIHAEYIDEYCFRSNRRNHRGSLLDKIIERCVAHDPITPE